MWQRWGNRPPTISRPMQFTELDQDDRYEERYLETIMEVESISSRRQSLEIELPKLPFRVVPPMSDIPQPVNVSHPHTPTPSSQRNHGLRIDVHPTQQVPVDEDVSPLTPQTREARQPLRNERPVSPIEPTVPAASRIPRVPLPDRPAQSQIPRKKLRAGGAEIKSETKWDEYSGEPLTDGRGKPASVRPGSQPLEMQYPHLKERTKQILAGLRERDVAKNPSQGRKPLAVANDLLDHPSQREVWMAASGRTPVVEPVRDIPPAYQAPVQPASGIEYPTNAFELSSEQTTPSDTPQNTPHLRQVASEEDIRPLAPLKIGKRIKTPELVTKPLDRDPRPRSPSTSPASLFTLYEPTHQIPRYRADSPQNYDEPKTPDTPIPVGTPSIAGKSDGLLPYGAPGSDREQSRFSWTTFTTSTAESPQSLAQVVRDSSPPPPIPDLPPAITTKKRPVSSSPFMQSSPYSIQSYADSITSVVRKPLPGASNRSSSGSTATSRAMSTSKSLPPTPTVLEASDRIENFDAQLEDLRRQRHNTTKIILGLEASLKKNAIVYDMWKRREVEKNIINHRMELDEIGSEIHDISLLLHRVQRKRDKEDGYEVCTGLWIKRVTS